MTPQDENFIHVVTSEGDEFIHVSDPTERSLAARHANAVRTYASTGDPNRISQFKGLSVAGHALATDLDDLDEMLRTGEAGWPEMYEGGY